MRRSHHALNFVTALLVACGSSPGASDAAAGAGGAAGASAAGTIAAGASAAGAGAGSAPDAAPTFSALELAALQALSPKELPAAPVDVSNRFADRGDAAAFGQRLFFEPGFAGRLLDGDNDGSLTALGKKGDTGKVSCAGCHVPSAGFLDDRTLGKQVSLAAGWGRRKAPSLLDVAQASLYTWDGRRDALFNQPFGPIESPVEMNSSRLFVAQVVLARFRSEYEAIFGPLPPLADASRFPQLSAEQTGCESSIVDTGVSCVGSVHGIPGDKAEFDRLAVADQEAVTRVVVNLGKALAAYERKLTCGPGRFDRWLHGEPGALSNSEQRGARIFIGKGNCATCHSGPFLSDQKFHNVGLQPTSVAVVFIDANDAGASAGLAAAIADPLNVRGPYSDGDDGRLPTSVDPALVGAFRTPGLRCQARRPSFMHTGQLGSLSAVVDFFARGGDHFGYPGKSEIAALDLSAADKLDLVLFLGTLEGPGPAAELLAPPQ